MRQEVNCKAEMAESATSVMGVMAPKISIGKWERAWSN